VSATSGLLGEFQAEAAKLVGAQDEGAKAGTIPKKSGDPKNATPRFCFFSCIFSSAMVEARTERSTIWQSMISDILNDMI
jgi:hypothetical protein